jgi:two-component system, OmpR family, alkaline phosphatase synthesis response regulator PhoP
MEMKRILVVDDEASITDALAVLFAKAGYRVTVAHSGEEALARLGERPDLLILDVMMPGVDGHEVCRRARARADYIPILMLTAKDASWDKVIGLELGADAYLTKPFEPGELLAQAKALLRLADSRGDGGSERPLACGPLQLWEKDRRVELSGQPLELTPREFDLLRYFMRHAGRVLGRETLLRQVWGYDYNDDSRAVDVHVQRLRAKVELDPANPVLLRTVRGFGYCLTVEG